MPQNHVAVTRWEHKTWPDREWMLAWRSSERSAMASSQDAFSRDAFFGEGKSPSGEDML